MKRRLFRVPFNNVAQTAQRRKKTILKTISSVIDSGIFLKGRENKKLVKKISRFFNSQYVTLTASGHDSLMLSLQVLNLGKNDEVIFPVNAYPTAFPVYLSHVKPVPVDVDKNGQLDKNDLQKKLSSKTKVVVLVHLYGLVGNISGIKEIIKGRNIVLIEDCAQAFGTKYKDKYVGTLGDIGCFSFYPTKNVNTLGDGGFILTGNKNLHEYFNKATSYGELVHYESEFISGHSRLAEIQAGILNSLWSELNDNSKQRKRTAANYKEVILNSNLDKFLRVFESSPFSDPLTHLFVVEVKNRDKLSKYLHSKGIETAIHYPKPVHLVKAFSAYGFKKGDFPVAEYLSDHILSLPFHPFLSKKEIDYIIKAIKEFYYG